MTTHNGHRQRLKRRYFEEGLDGFNEVNALELLLFYCLPRQDTNPLAHRLIKRFGSFSQVLEATAPELMEVEGIGKRAAEFLTLVRQTSRYYAVHHPDQPNVLQTLDSCGDYMLPYFIGRDMETVFLLCMDARCKVLCCRQISEGSINAAGIPIRKIVEVALETKASSVVLAHNHPSGIALPSNEDVATTKRIMKALAAIQVVLVDHVIVAEDDYVSLAQSGLIGPEDAEY